MKRILLLSITTLLLFASAIHAEVRTSVLKDIEIDGTVLDMASSADGRTAFVLMEGALKIYSLPGGRLMDTIEVGKSLDRIAGTPKGDLLLLGSTTRNNVRIVKLDFIRDIDTTGSPFKGPEDARVTIAVFSDFQ